MKKTAVVGTEELRVKPFEVLAAIFFRLTKQTNVCL